MLKKLNLLIIAVCLSIAAQAGNDKNVYSVISKELKVPASLKGKQLNEKVNVQFSVSGTGKATVLEVQTANPELKNYVMKQFPKMNFGTSTENKENIYFVDINFKVL